MTDDATAVPLADLASRCDETELRFVDDYLVHLNATRAAISVGHEEGAASFGWQMLARPHVRAYMQARLAERNYADGINVERALQEVVTLAHVNILDYTKIGTDGQPELDWDKVNENPRLGAAIQEIVIDTRTVGTGDDAYESRRVKFKLHDKHKSLDMLAKYLRILTDRVEVTGKDGEPLVLSDREVARRVAFALAAGMRAPQPASFPELE